MCYFSCRKSRLIKLWYWSIFLSRFLSVCPSISLSLSFSEMNIMMVKIVETNLQINFIKYLMYNCVDEMCFVCKDKVLVVDRLKRKKLLFHNFEPEGNCNLIKNYSNLSDLKLYLNWKNRSIHMKSLIYWYIEINRKKY